MPPIAAKKKVLRTISNRPVKVIVEVETAKAIVPVESPSAGKLADILAREGMTVQMSQPLGTVQPA